MSADNSIILLKTPRHKEEGFDYRVIHAMAIENIYWDEKKKKRTLEINPKILLEQFDQCKVLAEKESWEEACRLEKEVGYVEYGISELPLPKPFEYYRFIVNRKAPVTV